MKSYREIGEILKAAREAKGLTPEAVHKKTNVHPSVIKKLEDGTAENTLSIIYLRAFIRKYAGFLGMDARDLLGGHELTDRKETEQKMHLDPDRKPHIDVEKYAHLVFPAAAGILILIFVFIGAAKIKGLIINHSQNASKRVSAPGAAKGSAKDGGAPKQAKLLNIDLSKSGLYVTVKSSDKVWLRVSQDGDAVFEGFLNKDSHEGWKAKNEIKMRAGKLDVLEFSLNDAYIGKIGSGVEDIMITKDGIKVGRKWVYRTAY